MTVAGLPLESWLLVGAAVGIGLAVEIAFFVAHRQRRSSPPLPPDPPRDLRAPTNDLPPGRRSASSPGGEPPARPGPSEPAS